MQVEVVRYDQSWRALYETEAIKITESLGPVAVAIHHIGSTAVPGLCAKPIIDILLGVDDISSLDSKVSQMEWLGYEAMGEFGILGRRYFRRTNSGGTRTHQIHAFEKESPAFERHLAFRDYLTENPETAAEYGILKRELAKRFPSNIEAYTDGKNSFIKTYEAKAITWRTKD